MGQEKGFSVDATENSEIFNDDSLKKYSAVIFLNTTGDILNTAQEASFERYIQAGGGFVGIHSATDTEYDRSEEHTSELQSLMRTSYAVFCLKKKKKK